MLLRENRLLDHVIELHWRWSWREPLDLGRGGKGGATNNQVPELIQSDPLGRIDFKNACENSLQRARDRQNGAEEPPVLEICTVCRVLGRSPFPWIPAAHQVDQNNTQAPYIIWPRGIASLRNW